ncbi:MAG: hypothetical protein MUF01_06080, partial [Bryobacterales bacterium]|nr:hypothetical protein [Bryobacterales bacterium]
MQEQTWVSRCGGRIMWLATWLLVASATSWSQVSWVAPSAASYADAIRFSSDEQRRLCRGVVDGNTYLGAEEDQICQVNVNGTAIKLPSFEFAVGLAHWELVASQLNIPVGLIAGQQGSNLLFACRVADGNSYGVGWGIEIDNVRTCHYVFRGNARSSKDMDYLFPIAADESVQVTLANNQCLTITPPGNEGPVATHSTCNQTNRQVWNLRLRGGSSASLASAAFDGCLAPKGDGSLTLTPCSAPASNLRVSWVNDTELTIRATSTGEFLEINNGSVDQDIALKASTGPTTPWRRATIRTLADSARRLKLLTYNTMMFGKLVQPFAQNELRMTFILDALRREAEQPDVIVLAEIFDEFMRPFLRGRLSAMGYRHWATSPLSPISFVQPSGMWIQSKWPIEESAHILFSQSSGSDSFSLKGVVYARINKMGRRYHVFGTHLQSGFEQSPVRTSQLNEMANFVAARTTPGSNEPIILAGDFNIDMEGQTADYNLMLALLNAQFVSPPRPVGVPA